MATSSISNLSAPTDQEIIELFFARDQGALDATAQRYRRFLYTISYNIVKDRQDSEECLNDVYLALWETIPPNRPNSFKAYLIALTCRIATDRYRMRKRQKRVPDEMASSLSELEFLLCSPDSPERTFETKLLTEALDRFLKELDSEDRALFVSRYYLCMSGDSIARAKDLSKTKVCKKLERIKNELKKQLETEGFLL